MSPAIGGGAPVAEDGFAGTTPARDHPSQGPPQGPPASGGFIGEATSCEAAHPVSELGSKGLSVTAMEPGAVPGPPPPTSCDLLALLGIFERSQRRNGDL